MVCLLAYFSSSRFFYIPWYLHLSIWLKRAAAQTACSLFGGERDNQSGSRPSPASPPCLRNQEIWPPSFVTQEFTWVPTLQALSWTLGKQKWKLVCFCLASDTPCDTGSFLGLFHLPTYPKSSLSSTLKSHISQSNMGDGEEGRILILSLEKAKESIFPYIYGTQCYLCIWFS